MNFKILGSVGLAAIVSILGSSVSGQAAPKVISANWNSHYTVSGSSVKFTSNCSNTGPAITINGDIATLGWAQATIKVSNNKWDTKSYTVMGQGKVTLAVQDGAKKQFNKQGGVNGGVGGNPWLGWAYSNDSNITWLGRCVQGANGNNIDGSGSLLNRLVYTIATTNCSPSASAFNNNGLNNQNGVAGLVYLYNSTTNPQQTDTTNGSLTVGSQTPISDPVPQNKSSSLNLAGGNPHVYVQLASTTDLNLDGTPKIDAIWTPLRPDGSDVNGYVYAGRCKDLLQ